MPNRAAIVTDAVPPRQPNRLEQAERLLDEAESALDQLLAIGPLPADDAAFRVN